jgi:hypothetical protein
LCPRRETVSGVSLRGAVDPYRSVRANRPVRSDLVVRNDLVGTALIVLPVTEAATHSSCVQPFFAPPICSTA